MRSSVSRYGLLLVSFIVLIVALSLWNLRRASALRAAELLNRTYNADNTLAYSGLSTVTAMYGDQKMESQARVIRAPGKLSLTYISGSNKGLQSGYNERWFWRRESASAPMEAYAEVKLSPDKMAAKRFELMMKNYRSHWIGEDSISGRPADIVDIHPHVYIDGARGPVKRVWVDRESGLTLRTDNFNYQKQLVMSTVLSELNLHPNVQAALFTSPDAMATVARRDGWTAEEMGEDTGKVEMATGIRISIPRYLPPGFVFDGVGVHHCKEASGEQSAALSRFNDGINSLTIFAMPRRAKPTGKAAGQKRGACDFGPGTMVMAQRADLQTLAVGDLPPATLQRVLDSTEVTQVASPK